MSDVQLFSFSIYQGLASARHRRRALSFWHQKETKNAG
jgi:hypothetical protein